MTIQFMYHDEEVVALLQSVELALSPMGLAGFLGGAVDEYFVQRVENRFASEGDDVTGTWAPLAAATQSIRASLGFGASHPINVRTGEMLDFVRTSSTRAESYGALYQMPEMTPQGDLAEKMDLAQNGGVSAAGKPVPARPVLGMNAIDLGAVVELLAKHVSVGGSIL